MTRGHPRLRIPLIPYTCSDVSVHVGQTGGRRPRSGRRRGLAIYPLTLTSSRSRAGSLSRPPWRWSKGLPEAFALEKPFGHGLCAGAASYCRRTSTIGS